MIVRILHEAQYEVDDAQYAEIHRIDDALLEALERGDANAFHQLYSGVVALVRSGHPVSEVAVASDLVLPPADISLEEAQKLMHEPLE